MLKIKGMGAEEAAKSHNMHGAIEWWAYSEVVRLRGTQGIAGQRYTPLGVCPYRDNGSCGGALGLPS
jgi:hypothetical protein